MKTQCYCILSLLLCLFFSHPSFAEKPPHEMPVGPINPADIYSSDGSIAGLFATLYTLLDSDISNAQKNDILNLIHQIKLGLSLEAGYSTHALAKNAFWGSFVIESGAFKGETVFFAAFVVGDKLRVVVSGADGKIIGGVTVSLDGSIDEIYSGIVNGLNANGIDGAISAEVARKVVWWLIMRYPNKYLVWHFKNPAADFSFSNVAFNRSTVKKLYQLFKENGLLSSRQEFEAQFEQQFNTYFKAEK